MSRKVKGLLITIFFILALAIFFLMLIWFSGKIGYRQAKVYKIYFANVSGLKVGDPVEVLGVIKGRVKAIKLEDNQVLVLIDLAKDVRLKRDAKISIRSLSYIGSDKYLFIQPGIGETTTNHTLFYGENESLNLEATFLKIDQLIDSLGLHQLGDEFKRAKDELIQAVHNLPTFVQPFTFSLTRLIYTLEKLSTKFDSLNTLLNSESTIKELLSSKELYNELLNTNRQLQDLLNDIKVNPQKYIKLRLF